MTYIASDPKVLVCKNLNALLSSYVSMHNSTQNSFAAQAGLSRSSLSSYLSGARYPRPEQIRAMCTVLGVPVARLFAEVKDGGA